MNDVDADLLVGVLLVGLEVVEHLAGTNQGDSAAGDDAFFDSRTGCVHCVFDTCLLFLHLGLGRGTDLDHRNTADQFGKTLLQFFTIVVAGRVLDLIADRLDAAVDRFAGTGAFDDGGVFLVDGDLFGFAEVVERDGLELDAEIFADDLAAR